MTFLPLLRLLRLIPNSVPGRYRLCRWLVTKLAPLGEAQIHALGLQWVVPSLREPIAAALLTDGTYEPSLHKALAKALKPDGVFFDVGANIGLFALTAAHHLTTQGRVIAFEASPRTFSYLQRNALVNPTQRLTLHHRAVTEYSDQKIQFFDAPTDQFGMSSLANRFSSTGSQITSLSLDDAAKALHLPRVDVIKVDVEGFELGVFRGAQRLLAQVPAPIIFFEFNDWAEANTSSTPGDAQRFLQQLGYLLVPLDAWIRGNRTSHPIQTSGGAELVAFKPSSIAGSSASISE